MEFLFVETDSEELPNEPLPLEKANAFLHDLNEYMIENKEKKDYPFELIFEGDTLYKSTIDLPIENDFSLQLLIESELRKLNTKEATDFLNWLQPFFEERPAAEKIKPQKQKTRNPINLSGFQRKAIFFVFIVVLGVGAFSLLSPSNGEKRISYSELISSKEYLTAGRQYPKKHSEIEQEIYNSILEKRTAEKINQLEKFNKKYPTVFGKFDLAIFSKEYDEAIGYFEDHSSTFEKDKERMILVGYSFLKEDQLDAAKKVSESLKSVELEKKIYEYENLKQLIAEKEKELEELEKGGSKNREKAEKVAAEKFDLQEQLVNL